MRILIYIAAAAALWLTSCKTQKITGFNYLENVRDTTLALSAMYTDPVIQKNDLLSISVYSASINPAIDAPYNLPQGTAQGGNTGSGFLVDANGNIEYPRVGTLRAEGMTKTQLADMIKAKLQGQLLNPAVIIRFINYRITVLGGVNNPGTFTVPTERVTILEALGLAGDVSEFGYRRNVKIMRDNNGQRQIATIDLTSKNMFSSPYFVLQQNDVVFVEQSDEPRRQRNQQNTFQQVSVATGIITTIALLINFLR